MKYTVIVRTYNNEDIIGNTLRALSSQEGVDFELLIVDSGSTDRTKSIIKKYDHRIVRVSQQEYHPGKTLNMAFEEVDTEGVVLLNSDTVLLGPNMLKTLIDQFESFSYDAAYGRQLARPDAFPEVRRDYLQSFPIMSEDKPSWIKISAPISIFKKDVWEKFRFYDEAWGSEDTEFGKRLEENGHRVGYISNCLAMHSHNYTLKQLSSRSFIEGEADEFIYKEGKPFFMYSLQVVRSVGRFFLANIKAGSFLRSCNFVRPFLSAIGYVQGVLSARMRIKQGIKKVAFKSYQ